MNNIHYSSTYIIKWKSDAHYGPTVEVIKYKKELNTNKANSVWQAWVT